MIEWRWTQVLYIPQISEIPADKGSEKFPPYIKAKKKKLESMSYAIQQQTKTNPKLADNLGMLVEKFARMEERMNAVQAENSNFRSRRN
jgi:uncharacterized coiled-coil protein SlyX